jgi:nitrate reductase gamma subunit
MQDPFPEWISMSLTTILYGALLLFLTGTAIRIYRIAAMPMHVRWELYPMPEGMLNKTRYLLSEVFLLRGVYEHHRLLWTGSWLFHMSLYLLIGSTFLSFVAALLPSIRNNIPSFIFILSFAAYTGGTLGTGALIAMRLSHTRMRPYTSFGAIFNLALLFAIFVSGLVHILIQPATARIMIEQSGSLLQMNPEPALQPAATAHLGLIAFFIAYFPFTQMIHAAMKYFTFHSVRWDDRTADQIPEHADLLKRHLAFPMSWSAAHIKNGEIKSSWAEVITGKNIDKKQSD